MATSKAKTVDEYLKELPDDRREVISTVRNVVLTNLPKGYREAMNWGMISYEIPLDVYADTYNGQPLGYVGLAAQKNHYALYLLAAYADSGAAHALTGGFKAAGKKLDMGKSCLRFKKLEDLPLDVIATVVRSTPPGQMIEYFERSRKA